MSIMNNALKHYDEFIKRLMSVNIQRFLQTKFENLCMNFKLVIMSNIELLIDQVRY